MNVYKENSLWDFIIKTHEPKPPIYGISIREQEPVMGFEAHLSPGPFSFQLLKKYVRLQGFLYSPNEDILERIPRAITRSGHN